MYSMFFLEETGVGIGLYVWVGLALFFCLVIIGWVATVKGWLKKSPSVIASPVQSKSHGVHH